MTPQPARRLYSWYRVEKIDTISRAAEKAAPRADRKSA